ncbi:thiamine phosphate synthase [Arachnia propionica]|uniref:Thiamine-phosphate synthase n=1 Tax=Arachnia propionica TaxID=1750 RepID=A0AB37I2V8_9ACTN|nr:thiamine phosphate synthase [Arachnia propionica]QCT37259.1 thiamine phosphate synthase [Arachnia propionica]QUC10394.1 thiamine phosphate synthase [Arachnia propionica]RPA17294.1 thiamine phosphate synthase [Arachnia propionica]
MQIDWRLYYVTDPDLSGGRDRVAHTVEQAVLGGATVVQFRDKNADDDTFRKGVLACREAIESAVAKGAAGAELFVNDRLGIAVELGTHLHIGQSDGDPAVVREALGPDRLLGVSVSSRAELDAIAATGCADVVGLSPVWSTSTKTDTAPALGLEGVRELLAARPAGLPAVAIGGINATNAAEVIATGVDGICVVSAIAAATRPREAAARLKELWEKP